MKIEFEDNEKDKFIFGLIRNIIIKETIKQLKNEIIITVSDKISLTITEEVLHARIKFEILKYLESIPLRNLVYDALERSKR